MWVKSNTGNVVNLDHVAAILHVQDGGVWYIETHLRGATAMYNVARLNGSWATEAEADAAMAQLVDALDTADYG